MGKHAPPKLLGQIAGRDQVDADAEKLFELDLKAAEIEQRRPRQRVDQQVEIAALPVLTRQDRAEDARVGRLRSGNSLSHRRAVGV